MASSEADVASASVGETESSAAMDAKARREARKARILSSGTDRLARITKTGRGEEAESIYPESPKKATTTTTAKTISSSNLYSNESSIPGQDEDMMFKRAQAAMQGGILESNDDDPGEVDISRTNAMNASPFMAGQMSGGQEGMPQDMQGMMRMMQGMMGGGMAGGGLPGQGPGAPGADSQPPFAFPFAPSGQTQPQSSTSSLSDTLFNLLRIAVFAIFGIALVYNALGGHAASQISVAEDESLVAEKFEHMTTLHRWARLAYEKPAHWEARYFSVESFGLPVHGIPVFWLFISLELVLQSSRIMLQRSKPSAPGFLLKATAYIPNAHVRLLIRTVASYLPLLDAFVNDLAVVVFTIGCTVMFAAWKVGLHDSLGIDTELLNVDVGSAAAGGVGEKLLDMDSPIMGSMSPVQVAL
ncbi:hypothetical protein CBS101457_003685 [Exobasidium rhododendri]|nr:hypothetical protein CBS101457_003685 [Exobasidium rhododendri]